MLFSGYASEIIDQIHRQLGKAWIAQAMCCFHFWTSIISLQVYHPHRENLEASEPPSLSTYLILQSATTQTVKFKPQILSQHQLETHGANFRNPQNQATHKTRDLVASM